MPNEVAKQRKQLTARLVALDRRLAAAERALAEAQANTRHEPQLRLVATDRSVLEDEESDG